MLPKSDVACLKRVLRSRLHIWRVSSRLCQLKIWVAALPQVLLWGFLYVQSGERRKFLPAAGREQLPIYLMLVAAARIFCLAAEGVKCGVKGFSNTSASGHEAEPSNNSSCSLFFIPVKALSSFVGLRLARLCCLHVYCGELRTFLVPGLMVVLEQEHLLRSNIHF